MHSWVFRNRKRIEALLGRPPAARPKPAPSQPAREPRVVVWVPARRA